MGNSLRVLHGVIVLRKLPISKIAVARALKIISYLPRHGYRRVSIPLALNQQDRGFNIKQVRRHILMQDVRPPVIRVSTPNLSTERISFDLLNSSSACCATSGGTLSLNISPKECPGAAEKITTAVGFTIAARIDTAPPPSEAPNNTSCPFHHGSCLSSPSTRS